MKLPEEAVNDFIKIYKDEFGETLTYDKAEVKASEFLEFMRLLYYQ